MNLPVLFRTIDGTSQVTIETQYADRDFWSFRYGASRRLRFSFFKRQGPRFGRLGAFWVSGGLRVVQPLWARSSVG